MKGNTLNEFMDDLFSLGGPEKEFIFRGRNFFLETKYDEESGCLDMCIQEYKKDENQKNINEIHFTGSTQTECVKAFEEARFLDGLNIYEAESEIEVLFG